MVIIIKWLKTLQDRRNVATVTIPALGTSMLCPVKALRDMYASFPAAKDDPLFLYNKSSLLLPLTDSMARKHLKLVSQLLDYPKHFTFHDFRRGEATWAFRNGVSIQDIQAQGTWSSQSVWRYIQLPPSATSSSFRSHLFP